MMTATPTFFCLLWTLYAHHFLLKAFFCVFTFEKNRNFCSESLLHHFSTLCLNLLKLIKKFLLFDLVMAKESLIVMKSHVQKVATNIWIWKKEDVLKMNAFVKMIMMLSSPQWYFFKNLFQNDYMILIRDHLKTFQ